MHGVDLTGLGPDSRSRGVSGRGAAAAAARIAGSGNAHTQPARAELAALEQSGVVLCQKKCLFEDENV